MYFAGLQAAFHVFGMELLTQLDIGATNNFFRTFFSLPDFYWRGFLASSLSSGHLLAFAFLTMIKAPPGIQFKLMKHLITDPAGMYMLRTYAGEVSAGPDSGAVLQRGGTHAHNTGTSRALRLPMPHAVLQVSKQKCWTAVPSPPPS